VYLVQAFAWCSSNGIKQGSPDAWCELMQHSQSPHQHGSLLSTKRWSGAQRLGKTVLLKEQNLLGTMLSNTDALAKDGFCTLFSAVS